MTKNSNTNFENIPLLILAGGKATRLKNLSQNTPKYLMPINETSLFADYHLKWAKNEGFKNVFLSIGHLGQQIIDYCGNGSKYGLSIKYFEDGAILQGTGGAVRNTLSEMYTDIVITYGDTLLKVNVSDVLNQHYKTKALATMSFYENAVVGHQCNIDLIDQNSMKIVYNKKNPHLSWKYIDYGLLVLKKKFIQNFSTETPLDLADPLTKCSLSGMVFGYLCKERFWEIGSPEALLDFQSLYKNTR